MCVLAFAAWRTVWHDAEPTGEFVQARVIALGSRPSPYTGDEPVLTVQHVDGSTEKVFLSKAEAAGCISGSAINLVRDGSRLRVAASGSCLRH
jgi:hypothetical protein